MIIALVDKHPILRIGLSLYIKDVFKQIEIVEADNISMLNPIFPIKQQLIIILGFNQENQASHFTDILLAKSRFPTALIIVYEDSIDDALAIKHLHTDINGYLTKQSTLSELKDCISEVLKGKSYIPHTVLKLMFENHSNRPAHHRSSTRHRLTSREHEVATYLSMGMRTSWIAQKLNRKSSTISTIKSSIYLKLDVDNIIELREILILQPPNPAVE